MQPKLMLLSEWRDQRFVGTRKPSVSTIKRWIESGDLPGRKIGGLYYIDLTAESKVFSNNDLINAVLNAESGHGSQSRTQKQRA